MQMCFVNFRSPNQLRHCADDLGNRELTESNSVRSRRPAFQPARGFEAELDREIPSTTLPRRFG